MALKPILQNGDPFLREQAQPLPTELFGTPELRQMLQDMTDALDAEPDGVALAAPQIGLPYRMFVVRYDRTVSLPKDKLNDEASERVRGEFAPIADVGVFINPAFIKSSRRRIEMDEGCLSVRGIFGTTLRHERATVRAYDVNGVKFERGGGGLLAQIFQHETDHLEGILFIDHAIELVEHRRKLPDQTDVPTEPIP